jgi:hypothetical protein
LYLKHADWIDLAANTTSGNREADIKDNGDVTDMTIHPADTDGLDAPVAAVEGPARAEVGLPIVFDASRSKETHGRPLRFHWRLGDGQRALGPRVEHTYSVPGFYRLGLTVNNGPFADLAWRDLYVVERVAELGTESRDAAAQWDWVDPQSRVTFAASRRKPVLQLQAGDVSLRQPAVSPGMVQQWRTPMVFAADDLADEDVVIAARQNINDLAIDIREAIGQDGRCG